MTGATDSMALATDERRDLADLLDSLTPDQWATPSLCAGWSVRDVVAHILSYEELGWIGVAGAFARGWLRPRRVNDIRLGAYRDQTPEELRALLRAHLTPRGLTAGFGGGIALTDCVIHHQDIRRPLRLPRSVPADRLERALSLAMTAPTLPGRRNSRGLSIVPTDLDWRAGNGAEVTGPGEALLLSLAGRPAALDDLAGPGAQLLRRRVAR
jgi:uncharacterized protein (TIGR03083 family)